MFSLKINSLSIRLNNVVARSCRNKNEYALQAQLMRTLTISTESERKTVKRCPAVNITLLSQSNQFFNARTFCTDLLPKDPDVFGDIGGKQYHVVELDEAEQKIEEFEENEAKPFRRHRRTPGQYANMIKDHIQNGDLSSAEDVLKIARDNRDKPTLYMYSLLIRAFAVQGDFKKCFRLFNKMKKRGIKPNDAVITSLINSCSNSFDNRSLDLLHDFRSNLFDKQYQLNETHYNAFIKAYSRHGKVEEAFQLLDEMRDKSLNIDDVTFNNLLHGAGSQKKMGIKYALVVWHLMKLRDIKPNVISYNLLFRAIRDTELGDLKVNDILLEESEQSKIIVTEGGRPDLLATPPVVRVLPQLQVSSIKRRNLSRRDSDEVEKPESVNEIDLNEIIKANRLILFGGFDGIIKRMEEDNVLPNVKSFSLCLELIPNTKEAESHLIRIARNKRVALDTAFYNILIKRRCFRFDYEDAKAVFGEMEKDGCQPDIITWGVMALSCQSQEDGKSLLDCIENLGITPNYFIYGSLLRNACSKLNLEYVVYLLESMMKHKIVPSQLIYSNLDKLKSTAAEVIQGEKSLKRDMDRFKIEYTKFKLRYDKLQKMMGRCRRGVYESWENDYHPNHQY